MASKEEQEKEQESVEQESMEQEPEQELVEQEAEKPKAEKSKARELKAGKSRTEKKAKNKIKKQKSHKKYTASILKAFQVVRPNTYISLGSMERLISMVNHFFRNLAVEAARLTQEAAGLAKSKKRTKIRIREIDVAVLLILARKLAKHGVPEKKKTVPNYDDEAAATEVPRLESETGSNSDVSCPSPEVTVSDLRSSEATVSDARPDAATIRDLRSSEATVSDANQDAMKDPETSSEDETAPDTTSSKL